MFKISPINDPILQKEYANACGTDVRPGFFAYSMTDVETGALMGFSQFEISSGEGYLSDLLPYGKEDDFEAMFILARQTMNFIDICGASKLYASATAADERLLRAAGFKKTENGDFFCDMTGMFTGKCNH